MDLNIYNVIQGPWVTEKAYSLNNNLGQLVLKVHPRANKSQIRTALERLFDVKVAHIHVAISKPKTRKVGRHVVRGKESKKAVIKLKPGYKIDVIGSQAMQQQDVEPADKKA